MFRHVVSQKSKENLRKIYRKSKEKIYFHIEPLALHVEPMVLHAEAAVLHAEALLLHRKAQLLATETTRFGLRCKAAEFQCFETTCRDILRINCANKITIFLRKVQKNGVKKERRERKRRKKGEQLK